MSGDHHQGQPAAPLRAAELDLWRVLELLVWLAIGVLLVIGAEALGGLIVRERIAAQAQRHLAKADARAAEE